ncbi:hypothetical protein RRG08_012069 [Elysia crispata]|uniref:G-protein coupled receptors family 1 profile domain-containing protein n=1 Tax=Elysia crispata TaxID=231223 RepID=A0AAE1BDB2_9GAST|nr:hypothetical protein RRG08_012069 [Elysia crispata]
MEDNSTLSILEPVMTTVMECSQHSTCLSTQSAGTGISFASSSPTDQADLLLFLSTTMASWIPSQSRPTGLMSNWQKKIFDIYLIIVFGTILCTFGLVSNIVNLMVYTRQKNKDTVTLSLTYLSVSDIGVLLGSLFSCLCYATFRYDPFTPVDAMSLQYVIGAQVRHMFINISLLTTVFVSVERCLCVVMPLKVKFLVGIHRTHAANISFYLFIFATYIPDFISKTLEWKHDPRVNATRLMMSLAKNRKTMEHIKDSINHIMLPFVGQIIVMGATILMVSALTASSRFRQKSKTEPTNLTNADSNKTESKSWRQMNNRDKRVVRMVTIISTIFIICNLPMVVGMSCRRAFPEFKINGVYHNIHLSVFAIVHLASSLSASLNIFVYYFGSSKFKQTFHEIFCRSQGENVGNAKRYAKGFDVGKIVHSSSGGTVPCQQGRTLCPVV